MSVLRWEVLAFLWGAYYLAVHTVGRYDAYTQPVTWLGGGFVALLTVFAYLKRPSRVPKEVLILLGLLAWASFGAAFAPIQVDWSAFWTYARLIIQMAALMLLISVVLRNAGRFHWFFLAFLIAVAFNLFFAQEGPEVLGMAGDPGQYRREGLTGSPNAFGFYGVLALFGAMSVFGEAQSVWIKALMAGGALLGLYGVVMSASRAAFIAAILALLIWPILCLGVKVRGHVLRTLVGLAAVVAVFVGVEWVLQRTYLGERVVSSLQEGDREMMIHEEIRISGLQVFLANPIYGAGLGQYGLATGTGFYAHNEATELLATTGLVGYLIYISLYWSLWSRLSRAIRRTTSPLLRYRGNMARMVVIIVVVTGALSTPHFLTISSQFLVAVVLGTAEWLDLQTLGHAVRRGATRTRSPIRVPWEWAPRQGGGAH